MVEIIHRQSERLAELVSDLLELSRLDAGEAVRSAASPVPLETVARQALRRHRAPGRGQAIHDQAPHPGRSDRPGGRPRRWSRCC